MTLNNWTILAASGADVLHAASPFLLGGRAITAAGRLGIPSVAVFQTDVAGFARRNGLAATAPLVRRVLGRIHAGASLTLAPSSATAAMLLAAIAEAGAAVETTAMIGDTSFDMAMARAAGVRAVGVAWGYHDVHELSDAGADVVAAVVPDLLHMVARP